MLYTAAPGNDVKDVIRVSLSLQGRKEAIREIQRFRVVENIINMILQKRGNLTTAETLCCIGRAVNYKTYNIPTDNMF